MWASEEDDRVLATAFDLIDEASNRRRKGDDEGEQMSG